MYLHCYRSYHRKTTTAGSVSWTDCVAGFQRSLLSCWMNVARVTRQPVMTVLLKQSPTLSAECTPFLALSATFQALFQRDLMLIVWPKEPQLACKKAYSNRSWKNEPFISLLVKTSLLPPCRLFDNNCFDALVKSLVTIENNWAIIWSLDNIMRHLHWNEIIWDPIMNADISACVIWSFLLCVRMHCGFVKGYVLHWKPCLNMVWSVHRYLVVQGIPGYSLKRLSSFMCVSLCKIINISVVNLLVLCGIYYCLSLSLLLNCCLVLLADRTAACMHAV